MISLYDLTKKLTRRIGNV